MASDEQFSLCWNNFHANMSAGFHGLLSRGDLTDVTLAAEGRLLQAHKLVLSVCSPYFQEMFKLNPTQHPIVFLKDVSHAALKDLLQFMYQGEVNVKQEELASFISTAEQLQVKGLTGNQNEESSTPSKPKPTSRPGPRSQQRQSVMTKIETDLDSKPSSTPVAVKRPNRPSIASNNSSSSLSGPAKRKCVDPLEAGPSGSTKDEFVTIPDEDENNAVAPKMEPEFVNESMWDEDEEGTNNDDTNFGEDDSNMEMTGFDGSATGDGNISGGGEGGAVGDAQVEFFSDKQGNSKLQMGNYTFYKDCEDLKGKQSAFRWSCTAKHKTECLAYLSITDDLKVIEFSFKHNHSKKKNVIKKSNTINIDLVAETEKKVNSPVKAVKTPTKTSNSSVKTPVKKGNDPVITSQELVNTTNEQLKTIKPLKTYSSKKGKEAIKENDANSERKSSPIMEVVDIEDSDGEEVDKIDKMDAIDKNSVPIVEDDKIVDSLLEDYLANHTNFGNAKKK